MPVLFASSISNQW